MQKLTEEVLEYLVPVHMDLKRKYNQLQQHMLVCAAMVLWCQRSSLDASRHSIMVAKIERKHTL